MTAFWVLLTAMDRKDTAEDRTATKRTATNGTAEHRAVVDGKDMA